MQDATKREARRLLEQLGVDGRVPLTAARRNAGLELTAPIPVGASGILRRRTAANDNLSLKAACSQNPAGSPRQLPGGERHFARLGQFTVRLFGADRRRPARFFDNAAAAVALCSL